MPKIHHYLSAVIALVKSRNIFFILALTAITGGCWYPLEEVYENPVEPIPSDKFHISLTDFNNTDTIKLLGPATFSYALTGNTSGNTRVDVFLGERQLGAPDTPTGSFEVKQSDLKTGVYDLKVEIVTGSGSGSLADIRGKEKVTVLGKWIVAVFVDKPGIPQITPAVVNGYQVINWAPYTSKYFTNYILEPSYDGKAGKKMTFTNKSITSWTDSTYSGNGVATYRLTITNQVGSSNNFSTISRDGITLTTEFNKDDSTATIQFNAPKYFPMISHYVVMEGDVERMQITDVKQTTAKLKINEVGYAYTPVLILKRVPKVASQATAEAGRTVNVTIPTKKLHLPLEEYFVNQDLNGLYGFRDLGSTAQLVRYNLTTLAPIDSLEIFDTPSIDIPYKGQNAYFIRSGQIVQLNLVTSAEKSFTPFTTGSGLTSILGASNELVSYNWYTTNIANARTHRFAVYNMAASASVLTQQALPSNTSTPPGSAYVSDDGKFYRDFGGSIHSLDPTVQLIGKHAGSWRGFREDKSDEFFATSSSNTALDIYDAATLTLKKSVSVPGAGYATYDVTARKLIFINTTEKKVYAVDIDTNVTTTHKVNATGFFVSNGILITDSGEYFKIY